MLLKSETSENNLRKALQSTNDALDAQGDKALTTAEKLEKIEKAAEKVKSAGENFRLVSQRQWLRWLLQVLKLIAIFLLRKLSCKLPLV